jgi:hypothetical protein
MATWQEFETEAPGLAAGVREHFDRNKHKIMGTLRADGSPRLCGTEVEFGAGHLWLGGMRGNRRFADLRRDPRVSVHSSSADPSVWTGDARLAGRAVEIGADEDFAAFRGFHQGAPDGPFELFRVELTEAVVLGLNEQRTAMWVRSWRPGEPVRYVERD